VGNSVRQRENFALGVSERSFAGDEIERRMPKIAGENVVHFHFGSRLLSVLAELFAMNAAL
jgi:hypothetical protein